tara:strand:- start:4809 stop:5345 length:537 start_codon:yes stop_codon:yes gene_type:complete
MRFEETSIPGVYVIDHFHATDARGDFTKVFHTPSFKERGMDFKLEESYYSISKKNVIRGMHFQTPPHDHEKIVFVSRGSITDVVLDLRKDSTTYKQYLTVDLSASNTKGIYIPKGCAHGFLSLEEDTCAVYMVSTAYAPEADAGIRYDTFNYDWVVNKPIISERDLKFPDMESFESPF